jgi:hypothetical protein
MKFTVDLKSLLAQQWVLARLERNCHRHTQHGMNQRLGGHLADHIDGCPLQAMIIQKSALQDAIEVLLHNRAGDPRVQVIFNLDGKTISSRALLRRIHRRALGPEQKIAEDSKKFNLHVAVIASKH